MIIQLHHIEIHLWTSIYHFLSIIPSFPCITTLLVIVLIFFLKQTLFLPYTLLVRASLIDYNPLHVHSICCINQVSSQSLYFHYWAYFSLFFLFISINHWSFSIWYCWMYLCIPSYPLGVWLKRSWWFNAFCPHLQTLNPNFLFYKF